MTTHPATRIIHPMQPPPLNPGFTDSQILACIRRFTSSIMFLKQLAGDQMFEECVMHWLAISPEESKKRLTLTLATTSHQNLLDYFKTHPWFNGKNGSDKDETERIKQEITASFELCEKIRSLPQDKRSQIEAIINS